MVVQNTGQSWAIKTLSREIKINLSATKTEKGKDPIK